MVHIFRKVACLFAEDFVYSHFVGGKTIFLYTMLKKQLYMAPEAEPLVVQIEGVICESGEFPINGFEEEGGPLGITFLPESLL